MRFHWTELSDVWIYRGGSRGDTPPLSDFLNSASARAAAECHLEYAAVPRAPNQGLLRLADMAASASSSQRAGSSSSLFNGFYTLDMNAPEWKWTPVQARLPVDAQTVAIKFCDGRKAAR